MQLYNYMSCKNCYIHAKLILFDNKVYEIAYIFREQSDKQLRDNAHLTSKGITSHYTIVTSSLGLCRQITFYRELADSLPQSGHIDANTHTHTHTHTHIHTHTHTQ